MEDLNVQNCCADPHKTVDHFLDVVKRKQIHDINKGKQPCSEYHHLFPLFQQYDDKFQAYMRMKLSTFQYVSSKVSDSLTKNWCNLHKQPIDPEEKLVVTLRYTFMDIAEEFYLLWDIPHCIGAIDVRDIRIKKPRHSGSRYYNYKGFHSITVQAVVDAHYRFIVIDVGGYGHQYDATTFRHSTLWRALKAKKLKLPEEDELYDSRVIVPYFFIGDGAYPSSNNLLKPYPGKKLSDKKLFNKRLSRARAAVECAFGRLCQKYRIFYKTMKHPPETADLIVKATCILQNVIIDLEKPTTTVSHQLINLQASVFEDDQRETDELLTGDGDIVREEFIKFFLRNPINQKAQ